MNENYILIIGGSNKQFIDDESYLYKKSIKIGLNFIDYFSELLNTKIELIDNSGFMSSFWTHFFTHLNTMLNLQYNYYTFD